MDRAKGSCSIACSRTASSGRGLRRSRPTAGEAQRPARPPRLWPPTTRLRLITTAYERAASVEAQPDGSDPRLDIPGAELGLASSRGPPTLPPGIAALPGSDYTLGEDLRIGEVLLPSGRVVVGEYLFDAEPPLAVAPGAYLVHATLARYEDDPFDTVALATLVLSDAPTVTWQSAGGIAVDGGSTTITSIEGRDALIGWPRMTRAPGLRRTTRSSIC